MFNELEERNERLDLKNKLLNSLCDELNNELIEYKNHVEDFTE